MFSNLRKLTKAAITDYERRPRKDWVVAHCSQVSFLTLNPFFCHSQLLSACQGLHMLEKYMNTIRVSNRKTIIVLAKYMAAFRNFKQI